MEIRALSRASERQSRIPPEGDEDELASHPSRDEPGLPTRIGDPEPKGGKVRVEVLDLTGMRGTEASDNSAVRRVFGIV
jgi:hypothetical protein